MSRNPRLHTTYPLVYEDAKSWLQGMQSLDMDAKARNEESIVQLITRTGHIYPSD